MLRILDARSEAQLSDARALLATLRDTLAGFGAAAPDQAALAASIRQLDELFLVVIVGEFNAGKSAFINALLGRARPRRGRHADDRANPGPALRRGRVGRSRFKRATRAHRAGGAAARHPDCRHPGHQRDLREHERLTAEFVPRADLVLFFTSADRPFTETERAFMARFATGARKSSSSSTRSTSSPRRPSSSRSRVRANRPRGSCSASTRTCCR